MLQNPFTYARLLECLSALKPEALIKVVINHPVVNLGDNQCHVKDGNIIQNGVPPVPITQAESGAPKVTINHTPVEAISEKRQDNIKSLDIDGKVFTRADIGAAQLSFLTIEKVHEAIIQKLKPLIESHKNGSDLGALLTAGTIMRLEDSDADKRQCLALHDKLQLSHGPRGLMIYNLFRSGILRHEVLAHLNKLRELYKNQADLRHYFLTYWDSILDQGYPTAHFMRHEDVQGTLYSELNRRISQGISPVTYVYSRGTERNIRTIQWCQDFARENDYEFAVIRRYRLGHSAAIKIRISHGIKQ